MASNEIDCDGCFNHKEGVHSNSCKTYCNECFNDLQLRLKNESKIRIKRDFMIERLRCVADIDSFELIVIEKKLIKIIKAYKKIKGKK